MGEPYRCVACANVSGALVDSPVRVPGDPAKHGEAVRELTERLEEYRAEWNSACSRERSTFAELLERREETVRLARERDEARAEGSRLKAERDQARENCWARAGEATELRARVRVLEAAIDRAMVQLLHPRPDPDHAFAILRGVGRALDAPRGAGQPQTPRIGCADELLRGVPPTGKLVDP